MKSFYLFIWLSIFIFVSGQQQPVPGKYTGYKRGNPSAPILLETFVDFQCPDCGSDWPVVKQVLDHYGPDKVYFVMHIYPLWVHRQAWDAAKAVQIVSTRAPQNLWPAIDFFFANQAAYFNSAFRNKTESDLISLFAGYAEKFGVKRADFIADFDSDSIHLKTAQDLQLGITRQIYGTPSFYVNGFKVIAFDETTTYDTWVKYIDNLLKQDN